MLNISGRHGAIARRKPLFAYVSQVTARRTISRYGSDAPVEEHDPTGMSRL